jgi:hypothetical protein
MVRRARWLLVAAVVRGGKVYDVAALNALKHEVERVTPIR